MTDRVPPAAWHGPFFEAMAQVPVVARAARKVGIDRTRIHQLCRDDPDFKERFEEAPQSGIDRAEAEAYRRAVKGTTKGVWHMGVKVGEELVYSDSLLATILRANRKHLYGEKVEVTGADGQPLMPVADDTAKAARLAALMSLAAARAAVDKASEDLA